MDDLKFKEECEKIKAGAMPPFTGRVLTDGQINEVFDILEYRKRLMDDYFKEVIRTRGTTPSKQ